MKFLHLFSALFLTLNFTSSINKTSLKVVSSDIGTLQLQIQNIEHLKGTLMIALFKGQENFLNDEAAYRTATIKVGTDKMGTTTLADLPYGENYTIAIFHDVNDNGKMDKNFVGVPKEPYGFSNNAKSKWGPPKYWSAQ